jgi:hypothetical protein
MPKGHIKITRNCKNVLRHVRQLGENRWLWVDAMCIDHSDINERNHQIAMMKDIYTRAHRVLIYAGEAADGSDYLLNCLAGTKPLDNSNPSPQLTQSLWSLLSRPWFRRVWILQEAYVSSKSYFIVGDQAVDFSLFSFGRLLSYGVSRYDKGQVLPGIIEWMARRSFDDIDLCFALRTTRTCLATDPRDKVFVLLGLVSNNSLEADFEADYNLSTKEVLILTAAHIITSTNSPDTLSSVDGVASRNMLPSWVPSWSGGNDNHVAFTPQFKHPGTWSSTQSWNSDDSRSLLAPCLPQTSVMTATLSLHTAMLLAVEACQLDDIEHVLDDDRLLQTTQRLRLGSEQLPLHADVSTHSSSTASVSSSGTQNIATVPQYACLNKIRFWQRL